MLWAGMKEILEEKASARRLPGLASQSPSTGWPEQQKCYCLPFPETRALNSSPSMVLPLLKTVRNLPLCPSHSLWFAGNLWHSWACHCINPILAFIITSHVAFPCVISVSSLRVVAIFWKGCQSYFIQAPPATVWCISTNRMQRSCF